MRQFLRSLLTSLDRDASAIQRISAMRSEFARLSDDQLRALSAGTSGLLEFMAAAAVAASRILGQDMYDVQLRGALALTRGSIAEMQTGEGKTLAAVPAVAWLARELKGVHVMTVNDYLASRDASWMGDVYRFLGLSTGYVQQGMTPAERRAAYACDITYATANEIGFDVLRDRLALRLDEQVHRPFSTAVIDEVDSILIDEARIPLVIAGGDRGAGALAYVADQVVRRLQPSVHYTVDVGAHNASLTDGGIRAVEDAFGCGNLFEERNLELHTVVQDSLEAHALLRRDVDYLVKGGSIEMVDEFKGRIALNRRWPAGLHTAVETKGRCHPEAAGNGPRLNDDPTPGGALSAGLRHDRNGRYPGDRVSYRVRPLRGDHTYQPAGNSGGSSGRPVPNEGRKGTGGRGRNPARARQRSAYPGGYGERGGIREAERNVGRPFALRIERTQR